MQALHDRARSGDPEAREAVLLWAYLVATRYFHMKGRSVRRPAVAEPVDLASEFLLRLERHCLEVDSICRYTYRSLRGAWLHFLTECSKRADRIELVDPNALDDLETSVYEGEEWYAWDPDGPEFDMYSDILKFIAASDRITRRIVELHWGETPRTLSSIAVELNMGESAVRMRVKRFRDRLSASLRGSSTSELTQSSAQRC